MKSSLSMSFIFVLMLWQRERVHTFTLCSTSATILHFQIPRIFHCTFCQKAQNRETHAVWEYKFQLYLIHSLKVKQWGPTRFDFFKEYVNKKNKKKKANIWKVTFFFSPNFQRLVSYSRAKFYFNKSLPNISIRLGFAYFAKIKNFLLKVQ